MTSPYAAEPDNDRLRAGIVDGTVDPAGLNVRELLREVVAERDALRGVVARVRSLVIVWTPPPSMLTNSTARVRLWQALRALLTDTHDHADAAGAGGGIA